MDDARSIMIAREEEREQHLVREFLGEGPGFFVEVGAFHPTNGSQSWHLETRGWNGVLIEPQPDRAEILRCERRATIVEAACSTPRNAGRKLLLHVAGGMSSLDRTGMVPGANALSTVAVEVRTLDEILSNALAPSSIGLLSVDVEGHEIEALEGLDLAHWSPRLILLEDPVGNLSKYRYMRSRGYVLVRQTGLNAWYVRQRDVARFRWSDRAEVLRKYYLALPIRVLRNFSRKLRQPIKDWMRASRQEVR
jgi:FkbM family methyltransferase